MIKRINLIEKNVFQFTYLMLLQVCSLVILLNVFLNGYQVYKAGDLEEKLKKETVVLRKLEAQRDELMKKPVKKKISVGQYQDLFDRIESTPKWSLLLEDVGDKLPNTVWITKFQSSAVSKTVAKDSKASKSFKQIKKGKKNAKNKNDAPEAVVTVREHSLELSGLSSDMRNISEFTSGLSSSVHFKNLTLSESVKQGFGFSFTIKSEINTNAQ